MAIRIEKENLASRSTGFAVITASPAHVIYKGTVVAKEKNAVTGAIEVRPFAAADVGVLTPGGVAIDQNYRPSMAPDSNPTVGEGYDYTDFNRGGLVGTIDDATVWISGNSLVKADDTWTVGTSVYWDADNSLFTDTNSSDTKVGVLEDKTISGSDVTAIKVKLIKFA